MELNEFIYNNYINLLMNCDFCKKDISDYHDQADPICPLIEEDGNCDKCACLSYTPNIFIEIKGRNRLFLSPYFEERNICMACSNKLYNDLYDTETYKYKINIEFRENIYNLDKTRIKRIKDNITLSNKYLRLIIAEYVYER